MLIGNALQAPRSEASGALFYMEVPLMALSLRGIWLFASRLPLWRRWTCFGEGTVQFVFPRARSETGFTLIELMIVIAIIGIIAAIAVPNAIESRKLSNERACIGTIKQVYTAQYMFREKKCKNIDNDAMGEFAIDFDELRGNSPLLSPSAQGKLYVIYMIPVAGSPTFSEKRGYIYRLLTSQDDAGYSTDLDEDQWALVSWPQAYEKSGYGAYAITEAGNFYKTENAAGAYDGLGAPIDIVDLWSTPFDDSTIPMGAAGFEVMR